MDLPEILTEQLPSDWMDETLLREEIVSACKNNLDDIVLLIATREIDYLQDDEGLAEVLVEYLPVEEMTENEFAYATQLVITKCVLNDLEEKGYAEEVEDGKWKFNL